MTKRNPIAVLLLPIPTLGIYAWYWLIKTKTELNQRGGSIPTAWIWLIPFVGGLYWLWKYSEAVNTATSGRTTAIVALLLLLFTSSIGYAVLQSSYNQVA